MTGFGKSEKTYQDKTFTVDIKTLNSKQGDINIRLPHNYKDQESKFRQLIKEEAKRGKIDVFINVEKNGEQNTVINFDLAKKYIQDLKKIADEENLGNENILEAVLKLPDVVSVQKEEIDEEEVEILTKCLLEALKNLNKFRSDEGDVLEKEVTQRINSIAENLKEIEIFEPKRNDAYKTKLWQKLEDLKQSNDIEVDKNRFEQELIYYTEKIDITEEKVRLKSHCDYFLKTIAEDAEPGKKLGFITQEIGREINTLGSKANDADMQKLVVMMKDELEKIKEQTLNIL